MSFSGNRIKSISTDLLQVLKNVQSFDVSSNAITQIWDMLTFCDDTLGMEIDLSGNPLVCDRKEMCTVLSCYHGEVCQTSGLTLLGTICTDLEMNLEQLTCDTLRCEGKRFFYNCCHLLI